MAEDSSIDQYTEVAPTRAFRITPRFGHSNDFVDLLRTDEEAQDYLNGLIIAASVFSAVFVVCLLLLALFKFLGQERVGFLSGAPFVRNQNGNHTRFCTRNRPLICRCVFLVCGVLFITFAILFVVLGLANFHTGADEMIENSEETRLLLVEVSDVAQEVRQLSPGVEASSLRIIDFFQNYTAKVQRDEGILGQALDSSCSGLSFFGLTCSVPEFLDSTNNQETAIDDLRELVASMDEFVVEVQTAADEHATRIGEAQGQATEFTDVTKSTWLNWFIIITYSLTPSLLMVGVIMAWRGNDNERYRTFLSWVVLPIFVLQIIAAIGISSAAVFGGVMNADACSGGTDSTPDGTLFDMLKATGVEEDSLQFDFADKYIRDKCDFQPRENPVSLVVEYQEELSLAVDTVKAAVDAFETGGNFILDSVASLKVVSPFDFSSESFDWFSTDSEKLLQDIGNVTDSAEIIVDGLIYIVVQLECQDIVPLYTEATYDGACNHSVTGLRWMFYGFTFVSIMGLIMVLLRSSWQLEVDNAKLT